MIVSLQTLMLNPAIAVATLRFLADWQGKEVHPESGEEPGRIVHEIRRGEMTRLGESPSAAYYGGTDSTILYLEVFAETMKWLNDDRLFEELLPTIKAAMEWIDNYGDVDGDVDLDDVDGDVDIDLYHRPS